MTRPALFAMATLTPAAMLLAGLAQGGFWLTAALIYLTAFTALMDQLAPASAPDPTEFPAGTPLLVVIALSHLVLMPLAVWGIAGDSGLSLPARIAAFAGFGLWFGQVANPTAHELIHRGNRALFLLGVAIYVTFLFGHHASAHRHVHHRHVGTGADPNTARRGEGFYAFALRAWAGSFRAGLRAEAGRPRVGLHPYAIYIGGSALCLIASAAIAGLPGVLVHLALASHATAQLLLSDYVQHYGLIRQRLPDGRLEPVADRHSWNAPHWFSGALMLHAPRHSDHHAHPQRPYPALRLPPEAPMLPYPLPLMALVALFPHRFRRVMHPRLAPWCRASRESEPAGAGAGAAGLAQ